MSLRWQYSRTVINESDPTQATLVFITKIAELKHVGALLRQSIVFVVIGRECIGRIDGIMEVATVEAR